MRAGLCGTTNRSFPAQHDAIKHLWCNHEAVLDVGRFADDLTVPSFGPRMVCTICGAIGADGRPNWNERAPVSLFGPLIVPTRP